jgi:hypothetical protein
MPLTRTSNRSAKKLDRTSRMFSHLPIGIAPAILMIFVYVSTFGLAGCALTASPGSGNTGSLKLTTASLPAAHAGQVYFETLAIAGGIAPFSWSVSAGNLPAGVSLGTNNGALTGTPSKTGSFNMTISVNDSSTPVQTTNKAYSMSVMGAVTPVSITTTSLASGQVGSGYSAALAASGGTTPYSWSISSGALPGGVSLGQSNGTISGTPKASGQFNFTALVTDSTSPTPQTGTQSFSLTIAAASAQPPSITTASLPGGTSGSAYSAMLAASGGTTPYTWSITSGALPRGLKLTASSGAISGTPTAVGNSSFSVQVKDSKNNTGTKALSISIAAGAPQPLKITTTSLGQASSGEVYSTTMQATGGTPGYAWSITSGQLPAGLALMASSGVITGTATTVGQSNFTVQVRDSASTPATATKALSITVVQGVALDQFGGITSRPCPDQTPTDWNMQQIGSRWVFCTPLGHAFIKRGVYYIASNPGESEANHVPQPNNAYLSDKYGANFQNGSVDDFFYARLVGWRFNSGAPGAYRHATDSVIQTANKVPFTEYGSSGANVHQHCMLTANCKNIWNLQTIPFDGRTSHGFIDAYDPSFATYTNAAYASDSNIQGFKNSPYYMGFVAGDTDDFSGYSGACPTAPNHPFDTDPGGGLSSCWLSPAPRIATSAPRQMFNPYSKAVFADPLNYTKSQLASYLKTEYGAISALNTAWGCSFATGGANNTDGFGTDGTQVTGTATSGSGSGPYTVTLHTSVDPYSVLISVGGSAIGGDDGHGALRGANISAGTVNYATGAVSITFSTAPAAAPTISYWWGGWTYGAGFLDESGSCIGDGDKTGTTSQIADLDNFLTNYTVQLFSVMKNAFKAQAPTKLFFGISSFGQVPGRDPSRCSELAGAGQVNDVTQVSTDGSQAQMNFITNCLGNHPFTNWETITSETDSEWFDCPGSAGCSGPSPWPPTLWNLTNENARATFYNSDMANFWNNCNSTTGNCQWVGFDWWAFYSYSFFESTEFGLVTWRDNALDGNENATSSVTCSAPISAFSCGGEKAGWSSYGNFLGPVTITNAQIDSNLAGPQ